MQYPKIINFVLVFAVLLGTVGCGNNQTTDISVTKPDGEQVVIKEKKNFTFSEKVVSEGLKEKRDELVVSIAKSTLKRGKSFTINAVPLDSGMFLLSNLSDYYEKRYEDSKIRSEHLKMMVPLSGNYAFIVTLNHLGGYNNDDKISLDESTFEFFFLENDKGDFARAVSQELDMFTNEVSWLNESVQLFLYFDKDKVDELMKGGGKLFMTFKGLDITEENSIELKYPFSDYYREAFPETETMIGEIEA